MQHNADYKETDKKIKDSYTLEGTVVESVERHNNGCRLDGTHVSNICTKANRILSFLRRNLSVLESQAYKGLVHPVLEYGSSVWTPKYTSAR